VVGGIKIPFSLEPERETLVGEGGSNSAQEDILGDSGAEILLRVGGVSHRAFSVSQENSSKGEPIGSYEEAAVAGAKAAFERECRKRRKR